MSGNDAAPGTPARPEEDGAPPAVPGAAQAGTVRGTHSSGGGPAGTRRKRGWRTPSKPGGTQDAGWTITSYLIGGMLAYGGIGWLISRWTGHQAILVPAGLLAGLAVALVLVVLRYGRL